MVTKVRGSVIDFPGISASIPVTATYPAGTVVFNSASSSPVGWKYTGSVWEPFGASKLESSITWDPSSIAAGTYTTSTLTVLGAALGDYARASFSLDLASCILSAYVSSANTVIVILQNPTAGTVNIASGTLRVRVERN